MWFSISAFGKSKATEQEAAVVDKAVASMARSIQLGTREGVAALASVPARLWSILAAIAMFPFRLAERGFSGVGKAGESVVLAVTNGVRYIMALPGAIIRAAAAQLGRLGVSLSEGASHAVSRIGSAISASFVGQAARSVTRATTSLLSALSGVTGFVTHAISASTKTLCTSLSKALVKTVTSVRGMIEAACQFIGKAAARLGSENLSLYLSKISPGVAGVCSRCGTVVKSGVISLAARSVHAQAVALETVKRLVTQCATVIKSGVMSLAARSDHAQTVTLKIAKDLGASLAVAGARVSASIAAVASWCLKLFRGDGKSDSSTAASL